MFWRKFHTKVATGNHHAIHHFEDLIQLVHCFRLLQLGDQQGFMFSSRVFLDGSTNFTNIIRTANEGNRNGVHSLRDTKSKIGFVFFGKARNTQLNTRKVDTLV